METPGGGGYGSVYEEKQVERSSIYSKTYDSQHLITGSKYKDSKSRSSSHNFAERGSVFEYRMAQESV